MEKVYNVIFDGTFSGEARIIAHNREEAYEIASDLSDYFDIDAATSQYDMDANIDEVNIVDIEEEEPDWEDDEEKYYD